MNSIKDKNLLFYSIHPNDAYSREFVQELEKNPILKRQFVLVCVNDPKIRIPDKIKQLGKVPVLIAAGLNRPIFGADAVSWLKNNSFQEKANGLDYGSLNDVASKFAFLGDENKTSEYNQFFNNDYNHGFVDKDSVLNQQFANLTTDSHITTYDDSNELKKDIKSQMDQRLNQMRQQRETDVPKPVKRIGGLDEQQSQQPNFYNMGGNGSGSNSGDGMGAAPTYNPNPFAPPPAMRQPQMGGGPNLPFNMPPPMGNQMGRGPSLPFSMGMRNNHL